MTRISDQLDICVERFVSKINAEIVQRQRASFFARNGEVFHDDSFFDQRIGFFLFEQALGRFSGEKTQAIGSTEFTVLHSLFRVVRFWGAYAKVKDLVHKKSFWVNCASSQFPTKKQWLGFQKKDLLQGYLVKEGKHFAITRSLFTHPAHSGPHIVQLLKSMHRQSPQDEVVRLKILEQLSRVQLLAERQNTTNVGVFYSASGAFGRSL